MADLKILQENGWFRYYSNTTWAHKKICEYFEHSGRHYFGSDYTNYQFSDEEALRITVYMKKHNII